MSAHENAKLRVFVAEDDPATLELIVTRLTLAGYQTAIARNGYDALHGIKANRPAGVILDVNMPQLDGFTVMLRLRAVSGGDLPPIMMLTARHAPEDVKRALALGARDFLTKPFKDEQLLARVARLVRPTPKIAPAPSVAI